MFVIRSRSEYRQCLGKILKNVLSQRATTNRKKDLNYLNGVEYGFNQAMNLLDEWERQDPSPKQGGES